MALAADKDGLPISYNLYRGNQGESPTMVPFIEELKKTYGVEVPYWMDSLAECIEKLKQ